jgi:hypothetical protein
VFRDQTGSFFCSTIHHSDFRFLLTFTAIPFIPCSPPDSDRMAKYNSDLMILRETLNKLTQEFEMQGQMAKTFQDTFYRLGEMILELEEHFKQVITILKSHS